MTEEIHENARRLTLEERKHIKLGLDHGFSCLKIAGLIGFSVNSVYDELKKNGGREKYDPEKAHENYKKNVAFGRIKAAEKNKMRSKPSPLLVLRERVDNLEFQMEILIDTIKELKNEKNK